MHLVSYTVTAYNQFNNGADAAPAHTHWNDPMQRLTAYVRRTVLAKAVEYAYPAKRRTADSTKAAFIDAMQGANTGWWNDLIYTADVLDMFSKYRSDVRAAVLDFVSETGAALDAAADRDGEYTWAAIIAATGRKQRWEDYRSTNDRRAHEAEAAAFGLHFAVEYITGNIAHTYAPDL